MKDASQRKLRLVYGSFLGVLTVLVGILFIVQAALLYYGGPNADGVIYSREIVAERLRPLMIPFLLWIVAVGAGYLFAVLFPSEQPSRPRSDALKRLRARIPAGEGEAFLSEERQYRKLVLVRTLAWSLAAGFALVGGIVCVVYLANVTHFPAADVSGEILSLVGHVMPWVGVSLLLFSGATVLEAILRPRELASVKKLLVLGRGAPRREPSRLSRAAGRAAAVAEDGRTILLLRAVVLVLAVSFLIAGVLNGGMRDVLVKAVAICRECIGLG